MDIREKQSLCSQRTSNLKKRATKSETIFMNRLTDLGVRYMFQKGFIKGNNFCIADFYLPKYKLVIEIDGGYHLTDEQIKRDKNKDNYYKERGFKVLHIKNEDVETFPLSFFENNSHAKARIKNLNINLRHIIFNLKP